MLLTCHPDRCSPSASSERGFTLIELLVTMAVTTVILGATMMAMTDAMRATDSAKQVTALNNGLRTAMDLLVRDLLQAAQGLPTGRVLTLPTGAGAVPMLLPGPEGTVYEYDGDSFCPPDPEDASITDSRCERITAVIPGPGRGPQLSPDQPATDMTTFLAADSAFEGVPLTEFASNGQSIVVALPGTTAAGKNPQQSPDGLNITNGGADDINPGDLLMLTKGSASALVQVTSVSAQRIFFVGGDSLRLNQHTAADGTPADLRDAAPADVMPSPVPNPRPLMTTEATRVRMISYYIDATTDPIRPRLVRRMNNGNALTFNNRLGQAVAFDIEGLSFSYDLVDGETLPSNVRMDDDDLGGDGVCAPRACSPNQIRKVNIVLAGRSREPRRGTRDFFRNRLVTQVSLRGMAFVDRYR